MERYDAAIIGAGPDGLVAAQQLARAGLRVIVLERQAGAGGRAVTREFFPGFRASPFADQLPVLPRRLFRALDLARHGAVLMPPPASTCVSAAGAQALFLDERRLRAAPDGHALFALERELSREQDAIAARAALPDDLQARALERAPWPGESWLKPSLEEALASRLAERESRLHVAARALTTRAASPFLSGSALHLLGLGGAGVPIGGLGALGAALDLAARAAGAFVRCGTEVVDIRAERGRATALVLSSGEEIGARAIVSTLDVKRTFLTLVSWKQVPDRLVRRVARYRSGGAVARVLLALDARPQFSFAREEPEAAHGAIHVVDSLDLFAKAHEGWRAGQLADRLPATIRVPSLSDPRLAPAGKAVMTVTLSGVPSRLVGGDWTGAQRERLIRLALRAAETAAPRVSDSVLGVVTVTGADIEQELGLSDGDLDGGEVAPDQVLGFRPFDDWSDGRTAVAGLYLAGPSAAPSPFLLGVSALRTANAVLADFRAGKLA